MKKVLKILKRIILGTIILLVALAIAAAIILPKIFPTERVATMLSKQATETLGREISIQDFSFNPFRGLILKDIFVSNDTRNFSPIPMLKIDRVIFSYDLWPLLKDRKVVISEAGISGMDFIFEKRGELTNLSSLIKSSQNKASTPKTKTTTKVDSKEIDQLYSNTINFSVSRIFLDNSRVFYVDHTTGEKKELEIKDINLAITNISNDLRYSPARVKGRLALVGNGNTSKIKLDGKIPATYAADLELSIDRLAGDKLVAIFDKGQSVERNTKSERRSREPKELQLDFSPLAGYDLSFVATLGEFTWGPLAVADIKFKLSLKDMLFDFEHESLFYGGNIRAVESSNLSLKPAPFEALVNINGVDSAKFLTEVLDISGAIEGKVGGGGSLTGKLNYPTKITGVLGLNFRDGKIIDGSKFIPNLSKSVADSLFGQINGKSFDTFELELILKDGMPSVGKIKGKGPNLDIDMNVDLDINRMAAEANAKLAAEKARLIAELEKQKLATQQEIEKQQALAQQQLDAEKKRLEAEAAKKKQETEAALKKEAEAQLKQGLQGLGL